MTIYLVGIPVTKVGILDDLLMPPFLMQVFLIFGFVRLFVFVCLHFECFFYFFINRISKVFIDVHVNAVKDFFKFFLMHEIRERN